MQPSEGRMRATASAPLQPSSADLLHSQCTLVAKRCSPGTSNVQVALASEQVGLTSKQAMQWLGAMQAGSEVFCSSLAGTARKRHSQSHSMLTDLYMCQKQHKVHISHLRVRGAGSHTKQAKPFGSAAERSRDMRMAPGMGTRPNKGHQKLPPHATPQEQRD